MLSACKCMKLDCLTRGAILYQKQVLDHLDPWSDPMQELLSSYGPEGKLGFIADVHLSQTDTLPLQKKENSCCYLFRNVYWSLRYHLLLEFFLPIQEETERITPVVNWRLVGVACVNASHMK